MKYKHNFNEVCSHVPFATLLSHLNIPYQREGRTLKTEDIIVTEEILERENFKFDGFFYKGSKKGGSVLDFIKDHLNLKSKIKACEWLKVNVLGENKQKDNIPNLELSHCPYLETVGLNKYFCSHYEIGVPKGKTVMSGRVAFKLLDKEGTHRGYIGFDYKGKRKAKWYIPKGSKTSDILYGLDRWSGDYCILAQNPLEASILVSLGFTYTIGLINQGLTQEQQELLKPFKRIIVIHSNPDNIVLRLSKQCFAKSIQSETVEGKTEDDIKALF